ncbi:MAG: citryl-CoA lyase [Desulfitobacterium sp.]|nr:citryl-CoA lyase [Desulfitobacterium sp.]
MKRRRSLLIISGNNPRELQDAPVFEPDGVIIDLDKRVDPQEKDSARNLVKEALGFLDYSNVEVLVVVNPADTEDGKKDIELIARAKPGAFIIPKASPTILKEVGEVLTKIEKEEGFSEGEIDIIPVVRRAIEIERVNELIGVSSRVTGIWFDGDGLMEEFGTERSKIGDELLYPRGRIAIACRAAGINAIDTIFTDGDDLEGLNKDALNAKRFGYTGKLAIDGRQVDTLNEIFD